MSVRFARLRIAGFKSFAEAASVEILPGLTGIVGPNGCGKSNVVEALRWAMGESSARSLRGGEMDDLIFAGTAARPARNLAEVTLTLEDAAGIAPPPYHDQPELQISRRIERGAGSFYRVNGREARARDVQTLFADLASGARSSAMVSQGRVAGIVNARPEERRSILEEAAGITGLHARRHEAELKLRATEANLARAEDLRLQLETRLGELGNQARQASRYREIAAQLREAEAGLLALLHARARLAVRQARTSAAATEANLRDAEHAAAAAARAEQQAEAALPAPREAEAAARTALERVRIATESLAREEARAATEAAAALARLDQRQADAEAARGRLEDAQAALSHIEAERHAAQARSIALPAELLQAEQALNAAQLDLEAASASWSEATARESAIQNRAGQVARDHEAAGLRVARLESQRAGLQAEHAAALGDLPDASAVAALHSACETAAAHLQAARLDAEQAGEARIQAARDADAARADALEAARTQAATSIAMDQADLRCGRLTAERRTVEARSREAEAAQVAQPVLQAAHENAARRTEAVAGARQELEAAELARAAAQQSHAKASQHLAEAGRSRQQGEAARNAAQTGLSRAHDQHDRLAADAAAARAALVPEPMLHAAQDRLAQAELALAAAQDALAGADADRLAAERSSAERNRMLAEAVAAQVGIEAEADGLWRAVGSEAATAGETHGPALAEILKVPPGLESALAAVLADGLDATLDEASPRHWRELPGVRLTLAEIALPQPAVALSSLIEAPAALARILSHAGLIETPAEAESLHAVLAPGQCLVTRAGELWRWDGYRLGPGSGDDAAARGAVALAQRNRLRAVRAELEQAALQSASLREAADSAADGLSAQLARATAARAARGDAERGLGQIRQSVAALAAQAGAATARLDAIGPQYERAAEARDEAAQALEQARAQEAALPDLDALRRIQDDAALAEAACVQGEADARRARREAESQLEQALQDQAALQALHTEAQSRLAALLPQRARLAQDCAAADAAGTAARMALEVLPPAAGAQQELQRAVACAEAAARHETGRRQAWREAEMLRDRAQAEHAQAVSRSERQRSRIEALTPRLTALDEERQEAAALLDALAGEADCLADPALAASASAEAGHALAARRADETACRDARAQRIGEAAALEAARQTLSGAHADWSRRVAQARAANDTALARLAADQAVHEVLAVAPLEAEQRRRTQEVALADAGREHVRAEAALDDAGRALGRSQSERRRADGALSEAREARLRLEGRAEQADAILAQLLAETPDPPREVPDDLSDAAEAGRRRRIGRLAREREEIGPVNLRADLESREAQARADAIAREGEELQAAIARLRGSIGHLNREGRERLLAVFESVDRHFQSLFARMFGGGRAHLGMVGDDDPLAAGLEIYAQPPGKKLATLSLLSGGEQALCALSLIFAVFRCNPAPVCVLDEVDAPLDDANVGRFCALLADMVAESGTRFLVVTHHQLTMAHMDRLYGVTMQERGVSRLISVDLAEAAGMATPRHEPA